jgi:uncharacterized repeat protein (TIGR01451 family)
MQATNEREADMQQDGPGPHAGRWERWRRWELLSAALVLAGLIALALGGSHARAQGTTSADLKLTKTGPAKVQTGKTLTYEITVNNLGPDAATNVVVTDKLPSAVDYVSASTTQGTCTAKGNKLTCELGDLTADATDPFDPGSTATITVRVKAPKKAGTISNTAEVTSDVTDPKPANDSDTAKTTVVAPGGGGGGGTATCRGIEATIVGTPGNDELSGTRGRDVIVSGRGNDAIASGGGRDLICAGSGADLVSAGGSDDRVNAGATKDLVRGGGGDDRLAGRGGTDTLRGQRGNDALRGGRGADGISGGPGTDRCKGGPGNDVVRNCED